MSETNESYVPTQDEEYIAHIIDHLLEAGEALSVATIELVWYKGDDPRFAALVPKLTAILDELDDIINDELDKLPGVISREEAEFEVETLFAALDLDQESLPIQ